MFKDINLTIYELSTVLYCITEMIFETAYVENALVIAFENVCELK